MTGSTKQPRKPHGRSPRTERVSQFTTPVDDETLDFIQAIERFKAERGRAFPTWTDVLNVLKGLGYAKKPPPAAPPRS
jgi:hypothetical protein